MLLSMHISSSCSMELLFEIFLGAYLICDCINVFDQLINLGSSYALTAGSFQFLILVKLRFLVSN
jgi:hypothetical protein